jgi:hypothetical protein
MAELQEYQAFTRVSDPSGMPSQELVIWLRDLLAEMRTMQATIDAQDARIAALEP